MHHRIPTTLEKSILGLVLILANIRALIFIFLFPDTSQLIGPAWIEIMLWLLSTLVVGYILIRDRQMGKYLSIWRRNGLLALFLMLAILSILWSVDAVTSLFRVLELLFASLIAAYVGLRYRPGQLMGLLFWFGAGMLILSIALVYGAPKTGTMYWAPFDGAWRGVYWHRNHLGSIVSLLSAVYFIRMWVAFQARDEKGGVDTFFYLLSLVILYFTRSATGYILFLVLHAFIFTVLIWIKVYPRLQKKHYLFLLGTTILVVTVALSNLGFIFGLFNRDITMTGRLGLWSGILKLGSERFWLGHGFGVVWTLDSFREQAKQLAGWTSQPLIADNGLLDIYLHLGIIGVIVFAGMFIITAVRAIRYAIEQKTVQAFFPLLIVVYALFANITFSLFAETEVFVWFLIVTVLFLTTRLSNSETT